MEKNQFAHNEIVQLTNRLDEKVQQCNSLQAINEQQKLELLLKDNESKQIKQRIQFVKTRLTKLLTKTGTKNLDPNEAVSGSYQIELNKVLTILDLSKISAGLSPLSLSKISPAIGSPGSAQMSIKTHGSGDMSIKTNGSVGMSIKTNSSGMMSIKTNGSSGHSNRSQGSSRQSFHYYDARAEHNLMENNTLFFSNYCNLCRKLMAPMTKFYQCSKCTIKVDPACFDGPITVECNGLLSIDLSRIACDDASHPLVPTIVIKCIQLIENGKPLKVSIYQQSPNKWTKKSVKFLWNFIHAQHQQDLIQSLDKLEADHLGEIIIQFLKHLTKPVFDPKSWSRLQQVCGKCLSVIHSSAWH